MRYLTAGESHGKALIAVLEQCPAGLELDVEFVNRELKRRQMGYGRGGRMSIEQDVVDFLSGTRKGITLGSPIAMRVENKDDKIEELPEVNNPRPGHADLTGGLKYNHHDVRNILERSSARETTARVAVGAVCKLLLKEFGVRITSHIIQIGSVRARSEGKIDFNRIVERSESSPVRCADPDAGEKMIQLIDRTKEAGDTLGGIFEVVAVGIPVGLGSCMHYDRKLDSLLGAGILSIQAVKAVEIGDGVLAATQPGSEVHDEIFYDKKRGFYRESNSSGGFEGGMTNGEPVVVRGFMKPLSTLRSAMRSVNVVTKEPFKATVERSDVCAVPSAGIVGEAVVAFELARAFLEKFGSDSITEIKRNYEGYLKQVREF
ncbi:MAG: chorismate synthase [Candidatus Omnitrophica bacterium]|nr:chorismate synthase [Candidatus Omnitrophota bacterium]